MARVVVIFVLGFEPIRVPVTRLDVSEEVARDEEKFARNLACAEVGDRWKDASEKGKMSRTSMKV